MKKMPWKKTKDWVSFLVGSMLLGVLFFLLVRTASPGHEPGVVIRNNVERGIDATPLFYTEVENMPVLEETDSKSR